MTTAGCPRSTRPMRWWMATATISGQRSRATAMTSRIRPSASSTLVSYSNSVTSWPVDELRRVVPQKVTIAPHSGRVAHCSRRSASKGVSATSTQSTFPLASMTLTLICKARA